MKPTNFNTPTIYKKYTLAWQRQLATLCCLLFVIPASVLAETPALHPVLDLSLQNAEQRIVDEVDQLMPLAAKQLEQAVNINSGTMNFEGVQQVGQLFKSHLDELGFNTQWLDGSAFNRAGHLYAEYQGSNSDDAAKLLLIGHLDTVFAKDDPFQAFKWLDDRYAAGPGTTDMKGGNVILITALHALKAAGYLESVNVRIILTGDEENSGRPLSLSKEAVIDGAKWADIALGFEDGDGDVETAVIARRGGSGWQLDITGKPAHSSQIFKPEIGYGAILEASRILNEFREQLSDHSDITFNPGIIIGGTRTGAGQQPNEYTVFGKTNVVAKTATVKGGLRTSHPEQLIEAKQIMQQVVANSLNKTNATITFKEGYPPLAPTDGNRQLLAMYNQISQDLGYGKVTAVNPRNAGAADISFTAGYVDMAMDGLGLMGEGGHSRDEVADMSTLQQNTRKAALLFYRLSQ